MKTFNSMYLGLCVNNQDPERRGRVQVFVPHIMPTLYKDWNESGTDITINCVGGNIEGALSPGILEKLVEILPWAEAASPIIGTSAPGNLVTGGGRAVGEAIGGAIGGALFGAPGKAVGEAAGGALGDFFDQSPTTTDGPPATPPPPTTPGGPIKFNTTVTSRDNPSYGKNTLPGGTNGDWAGSIHKLSDALPKNFTVSSVKRTKRAASDHEWAQLNAYAIDIGINGHYGAGGVLARVKSQVDADALAIYNNIQAQTGGTAFNGPASASSWDQVIRIASNGSRKIANNGYRYQLKWRDDGAHFDHIHFGVKWGGTTPPTTAASAAPNPVIPQTKPDANLDKPAVAGSSQGGNAPETGDSVIPVTAEASAASTTGLGGGFATGKMTSSPSSSGGSGSGIHKGKTIVSASGVNGSGKTTVTYSDGTTATFNQPRPIRNNNPGNLEYGPFAKKMGAVGSDGRYAVFPTVEAGATAKVALLKTSTYQNLSIRDAFNRYAPPGENPNYQRDLQAATGFDMNRQMSSLSPEEFDKLTAAVAKIEGFGGPLPSGMELPSNLANTPPAVIEKTYPHGPVASKNTNDMPAGLFAYPSPGAMLWVFFREGNPLFPVYFAASYGQSEWSAAYRQGSPTPRMAYNGEGPNGGFSHGTVINPIKGGPSLEFGTDYDAADPGGDNSSFGIFNQNKSNLLIDNVLYQLYANSDRSDYTQDDFFETVMGYKESFIQGNSNQVVMGDCIVKVGNFSKQAVEAMQDLSKFSQELNQTLMQNGGGGNPTIKADTNLTGLNGQAPALPPPKNRAEGQTRAMGFTPRVAASDTVGQRGKAISDSRNQAIASNTPTIPSKNRGKALSDARRSQQQ